MPAAAAQAPPALPMPQASPALPSWLQIATGVVLAVGFNGEVTLPKGDAIGALVLICMFIAGVCAPLLPCPVRLGLPGMQGVQRGGLHSWGTAAGQDAVPAASPATPPARSPLPLRVCLVLGAHRVAAGCRNPDDGHAHQRHERRWGLGWVVWGLRGVEWSSSCLLFPCFVLPHGPRHCATPAHQPTCLTLRTPAPWFNFSRVLQLLAELCHRPVLPVHALVSLLGRGGRGVMRCHPVERGLAARSSRRRLGAQLPLRLLHSPAKTRSFCSLSLSIAPPACRAARCAGASSCFLPGGTCS